MRKGEEPWAPGPNPARSSNCFGLGQREVAAFLLWCRRADRQELLPEVEAPAMASGPMTTAQSARATGPFDVDSSLRHG
jgi:hypothetical protein